MKKTLALLLSLAVSVSALAAPRVVVQDAPSTTPQYYCFSPDRSHLAYVSGIWQQVLVVIDLKNERVLSLVHFSDPIASYAFTADNKGLAFVSRMGVHWLDIGSGELQKLADGSYSNVAVDAGGELVAVLGAFAVDPAMRYGESQSLGVWDRKAKSWKWQMETPVSHGQSIDGTMFFDDGSLIVSGIGGNPSPMIPILFPCNVQLDIASGKAVITTGPLTSRGLSKPKAPPMWPRVKESEKVKVVFTEDYQAPKRMAEAAARREKAYHDPALHAVLRKVAPSLRGGSHYKPTINRFNDGQLQLAFLIRPEERADPNVAVLSVDREGKIALGASKRYKGGRLGLKDLYQAWYRDRSVTISDLDGKELLYSDIGEGNKYFRFFDDGALMIHSGFVAFYRTGEKKPAWTTSDVGSWYGVVTDADEETLALFGAGSGSALIVRKKDGSVVNKIPYIGGSDWRRSHALSPDAKEHAVVLDEELHIFDVASAKETSKTSTKGKVKYPSVHAWSGGWVIGGYHGAHLFHPKTGWGKSFAMAMYDLGYVQEIRGTKQKRLILQDTRGRCSLVAPETGAVLTEWTAGYGVQRDEPVYNQPLSGRVVLRSLGVQGEVDLLDAETGQTPIHFHAVPTSKTTIGYIAYTPDGFWDASEGAERYVTLIDNGRLLSDDEKADRRSPERICLRIRELFR